MDIRICEENGLKTAVIESGDLFLKDMQDVLDFMALLQYEHDCNKAIIRKSNLPEEFFDLKTRLAGDMLQKFTNYHFKVAIVGDFSGYTSKSLKDFIYESNKAGQILFVKSEREALDIFKNTISDE